IEADIFTCRHDFFAGKVGMVMTPGIGFTTDVRLQSLTNNIFLYADFTVALLYSRTGAALSSIVTSVIDISTCLRLQSLSNILFLHADFAIAIFDGRIGTALTDVVTASVDISTNFIISRHD